MSCLNDAGDPHTAGKKSNSDVAEAIDEWKTSLERLYAQLADYCAGFENESGVYLTQSYSLLYDQEFGFYQAPQLNIAIGANGFAVIPLATTLAAEKTVALYRINPTRKLNLTLTRVAFAHGVFWGRYGGGIENAYSRSGYEARSTRNFVPLDEENFRADFKACLADLFVEA